MSKLKELSERAVDELPIDPKTNSVGFDPVTIALLVEVVIKIILYVYDCWKAAHPDSLKKINAPHFPLRFALRRVVRKVLTKNGEADKVDATVAAILKMGTTVTMDDLTAALKETSGDATIPKLAAEYEEA